jgi:hypothetical protein
MISSYANSKNTFSVQYHNNGKFWWSIQVNSNSTLSVWPSDSEDGHGVAWKAAFYQHGWILWSAWGVLGLL